MKIKISSLLYLVICVLVTSAVSLGFLEIENTLILYELSFGVMLIWYLILLKNMVKKNKKLTIALISIFTMLFIRIVLSSQNQISLQALTFLMTLLFMHIGIRHRFSEESIKFFLITGIIGATILLYAFLNNAITWIGTSSYTLGNLNPQAIGTWAYIYYAILIISLNYFYFSKVIKVVLFIEIIGMFYIMNMTASRGSLIAAIVVLILIILPLNNFLRKKWTSIIISLIPVLIIIISCLLMYSGSFVNLAGGSLLNGRENIWLQYLQMSLESPFIGHLGNLQSVYTHNIFLDHVVLFGYFFAIVFVVFTFFIINQKSIQMKSKGEYCAFVAFVGCLLVASNEGMVFSTGCGGLFVYCYSFLFLINGKEDCKKQNTKIRIAYIRRLHIKK